MLFFKKELSRFLKMISHLSLIRTIFRLLFNFQGSSAVFFRDSLYIISQANRLVKRFLKVFQNSFEFSVSSDRVSGVFACDSYILPHLPLFVNIFSNFFIILLTYLSFSPFSVLYRTISTSSSTRHFLRNRPPFPAQPTLVKTLSLAFHANHLQISANYGMFI